MAEEVPPTGVEPAPCARKPRLGMLLGFLGAFLLILFLFREVLFPFLMAIFIAYLIEPVVQAVTKAPVFGIRWTRGPTIVVMYVLLLGGIVLASSCAVARVTATAKSFSNDVSSHLKESGERATFELVGDVSSLPVPDGDQPPPPIEPLAKDLVIPTGTKVVLRPHPQPAKEGAPPEERQRPEPRVYQTEAEVVLPAGETKTEPVLCSPTKDPVPRGVVERVVTAEDLHYADGTPFDAPQRLHLAGLESATGLEIFVERTLIRPIVRNAAKWGYRVEPKELRELVSAQAKSVGRDLPEKLPLWTTTFVARLGLAVYELILILMLTAFIVLDRKAISRFFASLPPPRYRDSYATLVRYIDRGLAGVIRGQLVICVLNGLLTYFGLLVLGIKGAALLGLVAGVFSLIPIFGTILSSIPIVLIALTESIDKGLLALMWIAFIHLLEANFLNPVIMGTSARMHPVIVIFALLAGEKAFGVWGALLAVPTASIIQSCFQFYRHEIEGVPWEEPKPHGVWLRKLYQRIARRRAAVHPPAAPPAP